MAGIKNLQITVFCCANTHAINISHFRHIEFLERIMPIYPLPVSHQFMPLLASPRAKQTMPGTYPEPAAPDEFAPCPAADANSLDTQIAHAKACVLPPEIICRVLEASGPDMSTLLAYESLSKTWHEDSKNAYFNALWTRCGVEKYGILAIANAAKRFPKHSAKAWFAYQVNNAAWEYAYLCRFSVGDWYKNEGFGDDWEKCYELTLRIKELEQQIRNLDFALNNYRYFHDIDRSFFDLRRVPISQRLLRLPVLPSRALLYGGRSLCISFYTYRGLNALKALARLRKERSF